LARFWRRFNNDDDRVGDGRRIAICKNLIFNNIGETDTIATNAGDNTSRDNNIDNTRDDECR
jgi:hypothetical protein